MHFKKIPVTWNDNEIMHLINGMYMSTCVRTKLDGLGFGVNENVVKYIIAY